MSGTQVPPPYGDFYAGRGFRVRRQVVEKSDSTGWAPKDLTSGRWVYRVRAFDDAAATPVKRYDEVISASATDGADGWLDDYVALGSTAYTTLRWEIVEVDTSNEDLATPTQDHEIVLEWWYQDVKAKPPTS